MTTSLQNPEFPRALRWAAAGLMVASVVLAALAQHTGVGAARASAPAVVHAINLVFADRPDGSIGVMNADTKTEIANLSAGSDGFVRVALRSLARDRKTAGVSREVPFQLGRHTDGGLWLQDFATGRRLRLEAYGHANAAVFAKFLEPAVRRAP
jgi:putative photosynthetic complex assembly protein